MPSEPFVHATAVIDSGAKIGAGCRIWHFSHVVGGSSLGPNCTVGQNVMIGPRVTIGAGCKIQNNVSIYEGVTLEDEVFCGPSCVFTNVLTPRAFVERKDEFAPTLVRRGASIGANATIVCGVTIGRYAMVGAGAVVTRDVADHALVVGNPARPIGWVSRTGERLGSDLICPRTGEAYVASDRELRIRTDADGTSAMPRETGTAQVADTTLADQETCEGPPFEISDLTAKFILKYSADILDIAADIPGEYWTIENFLNERPLKWTLSLAVVNAGKPIAYAILSWRGEGHAHLHHFMVHRHWRGHSIGRLMIAEVEHRLLRERLYHFTLKVRVDNQRAQSFYRRYGFCLTGTSDDYQLYEKEL